MIYVKAPSNSNHFKFDFKGPVFDLMPRGFETCALKEFGNPFLPSYPLIYVFADEKLLSKTAGGKQSLIGKLSSRTIFQLF